MRILMILEGGYPPDVRVENEISALISSGHQVDVITESRSKNFDLFCVYKSANVYTFHLPNIIYKLGALSLSIPSYNRFWERKINKHLLQHQYDVLHVHDLPLTGVAIRLAKKHQLKLVSDFHENRPEIMKMYKHVNSFPGSLLISTNKWLKFQEKCVSQLENLVLVTNEAKDYYEQYYSVKKGVIKVVPNYVNTDLLMNLNSINIPDHLEGKFCLLYIGDTGKRRGTDTIIQCADLLKDYSDIHFVIMGTSKEQNELAQEIKMLSLANVELTGFIPFEKSMPYFKAANIGLCPIKRNIHHDTTYANKIFQYMAAGLPILVSDCPSQANVVSENDCGIIHESENAEEMAQGVLHLFKKKDEYEQLSKNATEAIKKKYNIPEMAKAINQLYESI